MSSDLISKFTIDDSNKTLTRKIFRLALVLFIIVDAYYLLDLIDLYFFVTRDNPMRKYNHNFIFIYRVHPFISFTEIILTFFSYKYFYMAFKYLSAAVEEGDSGLFYKANNAFYVVVILRIISFALLLISMAYRLLFTN
jgi:hypothetical protein